MTNALTTFELLPHPAPTPVEERERLLADPGFGRVFTDHMVTLRYVEGRGWGEARVGPRQPLVLDPATAVLHYAQEIFEGLKAYRWPTGEVALFRPDQNAARFNVSGARLAMPALPEETFVAALEELVRIDADWIPRAEGASLYLRPFMIATEVFLGVRPANEYLFAVIASPVGAYFKTGAGAITVWASQDYTRAAPGGTGAAKCGGNYAASLLAQAQGQRHGCDQVVFLDAVERRWVEELGGMNLFFVFEDRLITPPLGTILPGITRASILEIARDLGLEVAEQPYSIDAWQADAESGVLKEVFACGTAAVVSAVGKVQSPQGGFVIGDGETGPVTKRLKAALTNLQNGQAPDPRGWVRKVAAPAS